MSNGNKTTSIPSFSYEQANLISEFRFLISKITYLFRFYIVESITGIGNPEATFSEIYKVPIELNRLAGSLTGTGGSTIDFTSITIDYLSEFKNLIDGMISKDQEKANDSIRRLYEISEINAKYLARLSPYWDESKWKDLFYRYNKDLVAEVFAILTGDYSQALDIFQGLMDTGLTIGDYYSEGFINLLPENQRQIPIAYYNMIKDFRQIGTEWAYLTRFYMVTRIVGLGDDRDVTQKFYELILRIKEKIQLILAREVAEKFSNSLLLYMMRIEELVDAILDGDQVSLDAKTNAVYQYGKQLSEYLASINPYWDEAKWQDLFGTFARLIIEQSYSINNKEYIQAMKGFESLLYSALSISDYFALGLFQYTQIPT